MAWRRTVVLMKKFSLSQRFVLIFVVAGALGLAVAFGGRLLLIDFIDAAYNGDSFEFINKKLADDRLEDPAIRTIDYYQQRGSSFLNRIVWFYFIGVFPLILGFRRLRQVLVEFFAATAHPFHLALFRIVVFSLLFILLFIQGNLDLVVQLDSASLVPLPGWGWLRDVPLGFVLNPDVMEASRLLFQLCCLAGIVGFYTRTAAVGAAALGFVCIRNSSVLCQNKPLPFFMVVRRFVGMFSFGRRLVGRCRASSSEIGNSGNALTGGPPLCVADSICAVASWRGVFLSRLFGSLPSTAPEWALSDNLKFKMRYIWFVQGGWLPFFRLDLYPFLYQAGGLLTILFEMGFVIAVLHPRTRVF